MSSLKFEQIEMIRKKYNISVPNDLKQEIINQILKSNLHKVEIINLISGKKLGKFERSDLTSLSTKELHYLATKYSKKSLPTDLKAEIYIDILTHKINPNKLQTHELRKIGEASRGTAGKALKMYGGLVPGLNRFIEKKNIEKGKKYIK